MDLLFLNGTPQAARQRTTAMRTLHAIKRANQTCQMDGLMATMHPMLPRRKYHVFAYLVDETARRFQDPTHCTRHVLIHHRLVLGSMETDDTLRFVNQVGI